MKEALEFPTELRMRRRVSQAIASADGYDDALAALREEIRSLAARLPENGISVVSTVLNRHGGTVPATGLDDLEDAVVDCTVGPEDETDVLLKIYTALISAALSAE